MAEASQTASFPRRCGTARPHFLPGDRRHACESGVPAGREIGPRGLPATRPYTPAVRRWVCIVALLAGFSGTGYAWSARPRLPVPVERLLDPRRPDPALPEGAWWRTT